MTRDELKARAALLGLNKKGPHFEALWTTTERVAINANRNTIIVIQFKPMIEKFETEDAQKAFDKLLEFLDRQ